MQINHNISAVIANNQLRKSENRITSSVERLSSGLKINRASDDPSGMAISQKMKTQIRGLDRANDNANDGISVLQTAEGALSEVHSMMQRMRELCVQAANGTYTPEDREAIQGEINGLKDEINRISNDTQFNKVGLLDGSIDKRGYTDMDGVSVITFSDVVEPDEYQFRVVAPANGGSAVATKATVSASLPTGDITADMEGTVTINGVIVNIEEGDTPDDVYMKIRDVAETVGVNVTKDSSTTFTLQNNEYGSAKHVELQWDNPQLGAAFGFSTTMPNVVTTGTSIDVMGTDTTIALIGSLNTAVYESNGTKVTITNAGGFKIELDIDPDQVTVNETISMDIMDIGAMVLQIGANEGETMNVKIPAVNTYTLGLDHLNALSQPTSQEAIELLDSAIEMVSSVRSSIGAYQNRLEHAISNLETSSLNMENALSRIEDVDMAEEMTEYTASSVLEQAGTSVLAQANELPQTVLQLLQ